MRIAGGVLIIVVAVMNLIGGCAYIAGGALVGAAGEVGQAVGEAGGDEAGADKVRKEGEKVADKGGKAVMFGYFKLALAGLEIAAGVVLFMGTAAMLAKVTASLEIVNVAIGGTLFFGFGIFSVVGIVAAILAFVGAQAIDTAKAAAIRPPNPAL